MAPPTPPAAPPAPPQPTEVNLTKGRPVNLAKGQKVNLRKDGGVALTHIKMGLGWDPAKRGLFGARSTNIDLDASALLYSGTDLAEIVYFGKLKSKDASIVHSGDNLTGDGHGDDEVISVDLTRIKPKITTIIFTVTSYRGQTFEQISNAYCRLVDAPHNTELARFTLKGGMPFTAMVMAKVYRQDSTWKLQAIGEGLNAKTPQKASKQLGPFLTP
jgi:stress response protein SCP2